MSARPNDALAAIFRRLLADHHSLGGMTLRINGEVTLTDDEWEIVWDTLDEIAPLDDAVISLPGPARDPVKFLDGSVVPPEEKP